MRRIFLLAGLAVLSWSAQAQYKGPAVEACRAYALRELAREGTAVSAVVIERDASLSFERSARKLGAQPLAATLRGNAAVVYEGSPSAELSFLCLLADEKRPLYFAWQPRPNAPVLAQCARSAGPQGKERDCLGFLLRIAEQDLSQVYAHRFQEANERGDKSLAAYRRSNDEWREYRDAECARRRELAPAGASPEDHHAACLVELTRRRALDMR